MSALRIQEITKTFDGVRAVDALSLMMWAAARIYRVGVLMYGKRATLPEILRWLRNP